MGAGGEEEEEEGGPPKVPDAYEVRLLLAQDFGEHVEWAMNWFFEKENTGDRGREWGFSQAAMTPILLPNERLKVGIEMEYKNTTVKDTRGDPLHSFTIGPTSRGNRQRKLAWTSRLCSVAPRVLRLLMCLLPSPGSSVASAPKLKRQYPRGSVITPTLPTPAPARIQEKK